MIGEPDLIVVGGGSAGAACAARLAEGGLRVLLLEAGESDAVLKSMVPALMSGLVQNPDFDWCYHAEPDPSVGGRADVWPAGKRLGGGSAINGMMFVRGHPRDYDEWARQGATGWDYANVLPFFRRMEDNEGGADQWRGASGPLAVSEVRSRYPVTDAWIAAAQQAGIALTRDLNGEHAEGVDRIQLSQRKGLRHSTSAAYLSPPPKGLEVMTGVKVSRVVFDGRRATGVAVRRKSEGHERVLSARLGVVLSAGALNTPRLLMLSGVGPARQLKAHGLGVVSNLPGVGENLQEHPGVHLVDTVSAYTLNDDARGLAGALQVAALAFVRRGALTTGIGHAQAMVRSRDGLPAPNLQLAFSAFAFEITPKGNLALAKDSAVSTFVALMHPRSRGRVTLRSSDPSDAPLIEHRLLADDDEVAELAEGVLLARKIMQQPAIARAVRHEVRPGEGADSVETLAGYVRAATIPMFHPVGTAKIGADGDKMAVLTPHCAVRGVDGLWIADASVMPTIPQGNTNATSIMIGERASALILEAAR